MQRRFRSTVHLILASSAIQSNAIKYEDFICDCLDSIHMTHIRIINVYNNFKKISINSVYSICNKSVDFVICGRRLGCCYLSACFWGHKLVKLLLFLFYLFLICLLFIIFYSFFNF